MEISQTILTVLEKGLFILAGVLILTLFDIAGKEFLRHDTFTRKGKGL